MTTPPPTEALQDLISHRRSRLEAVRQAGENPFPATCPVTHRAQEVLSQYSTLPPEGASENLVTVAGRLMTRRDMGKAAFAHVLDVSGKLQVYLRQDMLGETLFDHWKNWVDLGDFVGFTGHPFRTRTGEITLKVTSWTLLSKALRPPPEKFHGMTDVEERYRRREVDLFSNPAARETFIARSRVLRSLRSVLEGRQFLEVETPIMQTVAGGAAARPFSTHHEALDMNLFLRIAPELFLKRLLVGGLDRVFEIGRAFRNEGIDTRHNPEFTILEAYQAYTDVRGMMELCEVLVREAARAVKGDGALSVHYRGVDVNLAEPFAKVSLPELFEKKTKESFAEACRSGDWRATARRAGLNVSEEIPQAKAFDHILDELILPGLPPASFLLGYPSAFSPLAKCPRETPEVADRFELFIAGEEVANAYSEQNDPDTQRRHFEEQARHRQAGDAEAMPADEEFLLALEQGMPPAGGLGIGIDRLTMLLTSKESIREVILFPLLRSASS